MGEGDTGKSFHEALATMNAIEIENIGKNRELQLQKILATFSEHVVPPSEKFAGQDTYTTRLQNFRVEGEAASSQQGFERNMKQEEELKAWRKLRVVLNAEFQGLEVEGKAAVAEMETFNTKAEQIMRKLTNDMPTYKAISEQELEYLMEKVEKKMDILYVDQNEVRVVAEEQEIIRSVCATRLSKLLSNTVSLQDLSKLERLCKTKIQKAGRKVVSPEGMAAKQNKELSQAEKDSLESTDSSGRAFS